MPPAAGKLMDKVMAKDREFFEQNPGLKVAYRPELPGEHWPLQWCKEATTRVEYLAPGMRVRRRECAHDHSEEEQDKLPDVASISLEEHERLLDAARSMDKPRKKRRNRH